MKKVFLLTIITCLSLVAFAQSVDLRRKISVSGTAQQEVTPDIINVNISLQEYLNGKTKVTIDQLENQLETAVKDAGIPKEDFTVNNLYGYNNTYQKKKNPDFLASKQYTIRFHDLNKYNQILSAVDPKGIQSTNIESYDYSKITELKRELKIQALLAAKEKATYLLSSIGNKLGSVIEITDVENNGMEPQAMFANRAVSFKALAQVSDIDFKKIKLSFQVNVVFEIIP
ncbi:MAG: SIMPL domain-containing protein [Bacteroidota bacterium]|nr:SIMPL domain-containing protein [Bacteroidota bacterium]